MRASYKPWYRDERYQGSLVFFSDYEALGGLTTSIGVFLGTVEVWAPGTPERQRDTRIEVLSGGRLRLLRTWDVREAQEQKDE